MSFQLWLMACVLFLTEAGTTPDIAALSHEIVTLSKVFFLPRPLKYLKVSGTNTFEPYGYDTTEGMGTKSTLSDCLSTLFLTWALDLE